MMVENLNNDCFVALDVTFPLVSLGQVKLKKKTKKKIGGIVG